MGKQKPIAAKAMAAAPTPVITVSPDHLSSQVRVWMVDVLKAQGCTAASKTLDFMSLWRLICGAHNIDTSTGFADSVMNCILTLADNDTATFSEVNSAFVYLT